MVPKKPRHSAPGEQWPTHFSSVNKSANAKLSADLLAVEYIGDANIRSNIDVGSVQANRPVPTDVMVYYYEVRRTRAGCAGARHAIWPNCVPLRSPVCPSSPANQEAACRRGSAPQLAP